MQDLAEDILCSTKVEKDHRLFDQAFQVQLQQRDSPKRSSDSKSRMELVQSKVQDDQRKHKNLEKAIMYEDLRPESASDLIHPNIGEINNSVEEDHFLDLESGRDILAFQKKVIWCQMNHYKRLYLREKETSSELKSKENIWGAAVALFEIYLKKLIDILKEFCLRNPTLEPLINTCDSDISILIEALGYLDVDLNAIESSLDSSFSKLQCLLSAINIAKGDSNGNVSDLVLTRNDELNVLKVSMKGLKDKLQATQLELYKTNELLHSVEKKADKAYLAKCEEESSKESDESNSGLKEAIKDMENEIKASNLLAESRLDEIVRLKDHNHRLARDFDALKEKAHLYSSRNQNSESNSELRYIKKERDIIELKLLETQKEIEALKLERREFAENLENEESKRRNVLQSRISKLDQDLTRVRANRDYLHHSLSLRTSSDENELIRSQGVRALISSYRKRTESLEEEVKCLRLFVASSCGNRMLYSLCENPLSSDLGLHLCEQLMQYKEKLTDTGQRGLDTNVLILKKEQVENKEMASEDKDTLSKENHTADSGLSLIDLKTKCELLEKTQERFIKEIETLGNAWEELEKQCSSKLQECIKYEDIILQCNSEKFKIEQKNSYLQKQITSQSNHVLALKKQVEKLLEQIKLIEQREKILILQLTTAEDGLSAITLLSEKHMREIGDLLHQITELKSSEKKLVQRHEETLAPLKRKIQLYEKEAERNKKVLRYSESSRNGFNSTNQGTDTCTVAPNIATIQKELGECKFLLKCSSCTNKFKTHALLKCMHTFCEDCIEETWNSRKRKCPSCGTAFSRQEIRRVYL